MSFFDKEEVLMSFQVNCYFDTRIIEDNLKKQLTEIILDNKSAYLKQGIERGYNVSIYGVRELEAAYDIKKKLFSYITDSKYSYDLDIFNNKYSELKDPNYKKAFSTNKIIIMKEKNPVRFQNKEQKELYENIHRDFDLLLSPHYFIKNDIYELTSVVDTMIQVFDNKNGWNSHISHFWYFFQSLNRNQKNYLYKLFKERKEKYSVNKPSLEETLTLEVQMITKKYLEKVNLLLEDRKINFYSPKSLEHLRKQDNFSSNLHKQTLFNEDYQKEILFDVTRITNRWLLNVFYEKLVLLKIPLIEKFFLNYLIGCQDPNAHLDDSIEYYLKEGEEKIW